MKKIITAFILIAFHPWLVAQNVGIGTSTPAARLHVADSNVVFSAVGDLNNIPGNPPIQGAGRRMMWYADKAAFRAGYTLGNNWDKANTGNFSFATGFNTKASADYSTAMGYFTTANGGASNAMGYETTASGVYSTAMGFNSIASGTASTAIGFNTHANGYTSTSLGYETIASGGNSTAMGHTTIASGSISTAMGYATTASGDFSTAMGRYVSTNNQDGSFVIGDNSTSTVMNSANANNFRARFAGGYKLFTSANLSTGCTLFSGDNAWTTGSDVNSKENFAQINGEDFLKKIAAFNLTSWNYKTQNPAIFRHYGPMAQDFYAAFGKDKYGSIGNDTTINSADFAGVSFIAIQALEKRTTNQEENINSVKKENAGLAARQEELEKLLKQQQQLIELLQKEMELLKTK